VGGGTKMTKNKILVYIIVTAAILGFLAYFLNVGVVSNKEAEKLVKDSWVQAGKYTWAGSQKINISYIKDTSYSLVEANKMFINVNQGKKAIQNDALFELGHFLFMKEFCPVYVNGRDLRIVCSLSAMSPKSVIQHHCIQSHIYAQEFLKNRGSFIITDQFINHIQFYSLDDPSLSGIITVCKQ
jgi:hypothetical protein